VNGSGATYETVSDLLVKELPELSGPYLELLDYWNGERPGPHIVYGDILNPFIDAKLQEEDREASVRIFRFIESLLLCADARVADMASVEICEHIAFSDKSIWRRARPFMGQATQKRCEEIRDWKPTTHVVREV
jgi:hypothetical protein